MPYVELHAHSHFSLLDGASSPAELVARAAALGMPALALTDNQGLYGAVRFHAACRDAGIRPIYGAAVTVAPDGPAPAPTTAPPGRPTDPPLPGGQLTLLVQDARGWASLCRLLSEAGRAGSKRDRPVTWEQLARHAAGLLCLTGGRDGLVARAARAGDRIATLAAAKALARIFPPDDGGPRCYVELQRHLAAGDRRLEATLAGVAAHVGLPLVATNDVHYAAPDGFRLQHVLSSIRTRRPLDALGDALYATPHRHLKDDHAMRALFADRPAAIAATEAIAERCRFTLDLSHARLPAFPVADGRPAFAHLLDLCWDGLRARYEPVTPAAAEQLTRELGVIERCGLADYFLVVHDLVAYARREGILCQGRGSAAGSVVAFVLGITPVDPLAHGLLFERFLSEGSTATPDIDIDFAGDRREEVIQYVYRRWGPERTGMVANVVTFQARSAVADVGMALGFPADLLADVRRQLHTRAAEGIGIDLAEVERFRAQMGHLPWRQLVDLCAAIDGFPRHLSIHSGGMLVTSVPLSDVVPIEPATMPGRTVVQWDKDDVADAGLIKIDLLSLRTLGMVAEAFDLVRARGGPALDLDQRTVPADDPEVWRMLRAADAIGCFQVESRAQLALQPRLQPKVMADLVVAVALIRPGPIQGGMAKAYLRRRDGEEPVSYWHPSLVPVLEETLGILVYQEQVLRVAMAAAGFTGAQADGLRRAMSRKRSREAMEAWRDDFLRGAAARGIDALAAGTIFDHLLGFASYGFCKSHAAAFARLTWVTAWLKWHHPLPFYCALLNAQPMGFYTVETVLQDARRHAIALQPIDVNRSGARWRIEGDGLRVPLARLAGLGDDEAARMVAVRDAGGPFGDLWDFIRRARPRRRDAERLVRAGAFDGMGADAGEPPAERRALLWRLGEMAWDAGALDLPPVALRADLPTASAADRVAEDYALLGLSQREHLLALVRPQLAERGVTPCAVLPELPDGTEAWIAGRLEVLQRPGTAKGVTFMTLEDETGLANVVFYVEPFERARRTLRAAPILIVRGHVQQEHGVTHLIAEEVVPLAAGPDGAWTPDGHAGGMGGAATMAGVGPGKVYG